MEILRSLLVFLGLVASAQAVIECNVQLISQQYENGVKGMNLPTPKEKTADCINCFGSLSYLDKQDHKDYTYWDIM